MSDYGNVKADYTPTAPNGTPTTEQVRDLWGWHGRYMDFDAWLTSVKANAWKDGFSTGEAYGKAVGMHGDGWDVPNLNNPYANQQ